MCDPHRHNRGRGPVSQPARQSLLWIVGLTVGLNALWFGSAQARPAAGGTQLWEARYDGPGHGSDYPSAVAVSPDGTKVVVTGQTVANSPDYGTIAYDASTGSVVWGQRHDGHVSADQANVVVVNPDGSTVFVTGFVNSAPQQHELHDHRLQPGHRGSELVEHVQRAEEFAGRGVRDGYQR
jgi:putative pyrroloquinoline-quinone binding quinoprotein